MVRILATGLGGGWLDGKVQMNKSSGCTMVVLDRKQPGGYTMVALNSVGKLERQENGAWALVALQFAARRMKSAACGERPGSEAGRRLTVTEGTPIG